MSLSARLFTYGGVLLVVGVVEKLIRSVQNESVGVALMTMEPFEMSEGCLDRGRSHPLGLRQVG